MIPGVKRVCLGCGTLTDYGSRCQPCTATRKQAIEHTRPAKPKGYHAAHAKVRKVRGPASNYPCIDCHQPAAEWAMRHDPSKARERFPFSTNPMDYDAMCKRCHALRDA